MSHVTNIISAGYLTTQQMVLNSPCLTHIRTSPDQTVSDKDSSNPLMADILPKIVWFSTHHVTLNEELASPKANDSWHKLLLFSLANWCCSLSAVRLQPLVDKKKVVVTEAAIREVLRLDDAEGVDCLPNEEIFIELVRMGYEKPSTKLTFYKAFFSSQ
nr:hypothetical protein [Tanacetum cinerariifolium]